MSAVESSRELGASEAYYQLLERLWSPTCIAAVQIDASREAIAAAWVEILRRMPMLSARVVLEEKGSRMIFGGPGKPEPWGDFATVREAVETNGSVSMDTADHLSRLSLVSENGVNTAIIAIHHSACDGRGLIQTALVLAALAGGEEPPALPLLQETVSIESLSTVDPKARRRELLALARDVREEPTYGGNAERLSWHDTSFEQPRDFGSVIARIDAETMSRVIANARAAGLTVNSLLGAAALKACAELSEGSGRVGLSTAIDLRAHAGVAEDAPVGQAAALIAASFDVAQPVLDLARDIAEDTNRRVARGDGELMFALGGIEKMTIGPESDEVVRRWTAAAPPAVQVSNMGVIRGYVPAALRGFWAILPPTPNQAVFVAVTSMNGWMDLVVGVDRNRVSVPVEDLAARIESAFNALADLS